MCEERAMQFDYFYGNEAEQFTFYRIPKILFTSPRFRCLSDSAKLLYGLMLDRMGLSIKNGWVDSENRAYIFFTTKDVMAQMNCGSEKATKILAELDGVKGVGLIERKKRGQGKPSIIYLKKFTNAKPEPEPKTEPELSSSESQNQDFEKQKSQNFENPNLSFSESENMDLRKTKCNNNKYNNTEKNETDLSNINPSHQSTAVTVTEGHEQENPERWIDRYNKNINFIKQRIEYDTLVLSYDPQIVMNCVHIMAEILTVDTDYYKIENKKYPGRLIQMRIRELDFATLDSFLLHFERRTDKIHNMKSYLITSLFNAVSTAASQIHNMVAYDMYGQYREGGHYAE